MIDNLTRFTVPKDTRKTLVSILRTAYLYAFGYIGYSLLFGATKLVNPNFELIRQQILKPEDNIIENILCINKDLDDTLLGLNIIYEPKEFRSLFVVFPVITNNREWRYGVFLPGPDDFGFEALKNLKNSINSKMTTFNFLNLPKIDITDLSDSKLYYEIWKKQNGIFRT